ncbi:hypothetical protein Q5762_13580 [Streptomyces sp. P9(2023)]|uniref:hypothetical protein n=1 Tax=Streptomyces sp. P9(2023) TaxID=3064394 RepID=UPI0028F45F8C|nr:hypothetical protein [Streptomyces sp. P9(2023)]MDT9689351.1 hypothetical protein [Streptomyces sp. P9(2023)]
MASHDGIPDRPRRGSRALPWFTACVGLLALVVAAVLALIGHAEVAVAVGAVGVAVAGGGLRVTVNVRR